jgi:hypothetical protein
MSNPVPHAHPHAHSHGTPTPTALPRGGPRGGPRGDDDWWSLIRAANAAEHEDALEHQPVTAFRYEDDPRIGTPIYALMSEFIDPRSDDLGRYPYTQEREGTGTSPTVTRVGSRSLRVCLYGSYEKGDHAIYCLDTSWTKWGEVYNRLDGQDSELTERLIREVCRGPLLGSRIPCPFCRESLLGERPPRPHRDPRRTRRGRRAVGSAVPIWAGGLLGWVHRSCHVR